MLAAAALFALNACGGGGDVKDDSPASAGADSTPSPAPADGIEARQKLDEFVAAATAEDLPTAWSLYAASITGTTERHRQDLGCDYNAFGNELPRMKTMFERLAPFETVEAFGAIAGSPSIELRLRAQEGSEYLATLRRIEPYEPYRVVFFNSGRVSMVPGAPDPLPSPGEPQGFCGIWTGAR
jgi:hypothetical protein